MAIFQFNEYVVGKAIVVCDQGTVPTSFLASDRRFTIRGQCVGTEADTSPENNFKGSFGGCPRLNYNACTKSFLPLWVNVCESISYTETSIDSTFLDTAIAKTMLYIKAFVPQKLYGNIKETLEIMQDQNMLVVTIKELLNDGKLHDTTGKYNNLHNEALEAVEKVNVDNPPKKTTPPQRLLLKGSLLVCWNGGVVTFTNSGQNPDEGKQNWLDDKAHIVIYNRLDNWKISAVNNLINETASGVKNLLLLLQSPDEKEYYAGHPYSFTDGHAEIFAPFVFQTEGENLSTIRFFDEDYQESLPRYDKANEGKAKQEDMAEKVRLLEEQCEIAVKLAYMVYAGNNAITDYTRDIEEDDNYRTAFSACNYGLWGKYYRPSDGWHRGIDMVCSAHLYTKHKQNASANIYSICDSYIIRIGDYYFNAYVPDKNVTITYMHLEQDANITLMDEAAVNEAVTEYGAARSIELELVKRLKEKARLWRKQMTGEWAAGYLLRYDKLPQEIDDLRAQYETAVAEFKAYFNTVKDNFTKLEIGDIIGYEAKKETGAVHTHIEFNAGFFVPVNILRPGASIAGYVLPAGDHGEKDNVDAFAESDPAEEGFSTRPYPIIEQIFNERMEG